jgi:hypothetical protein
MIELVAVMAITAIVVAIVFGAWRMLNSHMTAQAISADVRQAANRFGLQLSRELDVSAGLLELPWQGISYLSQDGRDTIEYRLDTDGVLTRNDNEVSLGLDEPVFTQFSVTLERPSVEQALEPRGMVSIRASVASRQCTSSTTVQVDMPLKGDGLTGWGF